MTLVKQFHFGEGQLEKLKEYASGDKNYGLNWPVVYILSNTSKSEYVFYVGETSKVYDRAYQHLHDHQKKNLKAIHVITDFDFNQSVCKDLESFLIKQLAGGGYKLLNGNQGLSNLDYYRADDYRQRFEIIWHYLKLNQVVDKNLTEIQNNILFKYSPYKSLTDSQQEIVERILERFKNNLDQRRTYVIDGEPGTGKTILATFLVKALRDEYPQLKIGLVVPMVQLRNSLKTVFRSIRNLNSALVLSPSDVIKQSWDVLIIDETHRLKRRVNLTHYPSFDKTNKKLALGKDGTQLDWILKQSKSQIFLYDQNQSISPADIRPEALHQLVIDEYHLDDQIRIEGGKNYTSYVRAILDNRRPLKRTFNNYDFRIFNKLSEMVELVRQRDTEVGLSRMLAGYSWPWQTRKDSTLKHDFMLDSIPLKWNDATAKDWPNSANATNEVGCIHTIQGYDLNYAGVIIGHDLTYDEQSQRIAIDKNNYYDFNGKRTANHLELEQYIADIYNILLTRGMKGTYIYVANPALRQYLETNYF